MISKAQVSGIAQGRWNSNSAGGPTRESRQRARSIAAVDSTEDIVRKNN